MKLDNVIAVRKNKTVYKEGNAFDIDLKTKVEDGFSDQDINKAKTIENFAELSYFSQFDLEQTDKNSRIYFIDFNNFPISTLSIDSGDYPDEVIERAKSVVYERTIHPLTKNLEFHTVAVTKEEAVKGIAGYICDRIFSIGFENGII